MNTHRLIALSFVILHSSFGIASAAPPPELTVLRQQYDKILAERVTAPFDANKAALDGKFTAALDAAIATAKTAGNLDLILALEDEKKRLTGKLPIPDDDDSTPAELKRLRPIYQEQLQKLEEQRGAGLAAILPAYTQKLKDLEAVLVKNDRVDEAKELRAYRENLTATAGVAAAAPAAPSGATSTPAGPAPGASGTPAAPAVKGDDRKAAETALRLGGQVRVTPGAGQLIKDMADLPKGRFSVLELRFASTPAPLDTAATASFAGLQSLRNFYASRAFTTDESLAFLATCPELSSVHVENGGQMAGTWLQYLTGLKNLIRVVSISSSPRDVSAISQIQGAKMVDISFRDSALDDAALATIAGWPNVTRLSLRKTKITDEGVAKLATLKKLEELNVTETPVTVSGLRPLAKLPLKELGFGPNPEILETSLPDLKLMFPGIIAFYYPPGGDASPVTEGQLRALHAAWPELGQLNFPTYTRFEDRALFSLAAFADLESLDCYANKVTDSHLSGLLGLKKLRTLILDLTQVTDQGLELLQGQKSLKKLQVGKTGVTDAGAAAFKKKRPDVELVR